MKQAEQSRVRDIGLFFLLGLMDERTALTAAGRVIAQLKAQYGDRFQSVPPVVVIRSCRASWKAFRRSVPRNQPVEIPQAAWVLPSSPREIDINAWGRYQKDASDDDVMALLFSHVLGFSDTDLAEGFQTSVGTIRYRLGKGVRQLGLVVRGGSAT